MSKIKATQRQSDIEALRAFEADAKKLECIEVCSRSRFNVFEAIGFVKQEIKHSRFLAFLLDPVQRHGLGDLFLKRFLQKALIHPDAESSPVSPESLFKKDLSQTRVQTEHQFIDILLTNETHEFAVIIENKVGATELSDQLNRYHDLVDNRHPDWRVFGIYLTPSGAAPSHQKYQPLDYGAVCGIVDDLLENQDLSLSPDVKMAMKHYVQMVRKNIVDDPEVVNLARSMSVKHRRALQLINKHRPVPKREVLDILEQLIGEAEGLSYLGRYGGRGMFFIPEEWWKVPALDKGKHEGNRFGFLRFVFWNDLNGLHLFLQTSPGDAATRRKLYEMGKKDKVFNDLVDPESSSFPTLYHRIFLTAESSQNTSEIEREEKILEEWTEFLDKDLPRMKEALKKEAWIWEPHEDDE